VGRFTSGGTFNPFFDERNDGEDTLRWIAEQSWCNGDIAMVGPSYSGAIQWMVAAGDAPALKAIAPNITANSYYEGWTYQGGAFELGFMLTWTLLHLSLPAAARAIKAGEASPEAAAELIKTYDDIWGWFKHAPLGDIPVVKQFAAYFADWLEHATDDEFWRQTAPRERYEDVTVPSLNVGGWYDCFLAGTLENYQGIKRRGGSDAARMPRLVIGPWAHGVSLGEFPSGSFGLIANAMVADVTAQTIRFFDRHLRGIDNGLDDEPPVRIFVMGANQWRNEPDWPLPDTQYTAYYLNSAGHANSNTGDGQLVLQPPADETSDVPLRPAQPGGLDRRSDIPARICPRDQLRPAGPPRDRGTLGCALLQHAAFGGRYRGDRPDLTRPPCQLLRRRHRLHRRIGRRPPGRSRRDPDRRHPARPIPQFDPRGRTTRAGTDLRGDDRPVGDVERLQGGASDPARGVQQQLPAFRSQFEHGRHHRHGDRGRLRPGGQPDLPRRLASVANRPTHHRALTG
jgi:hypothetical protein